MSDRKPVVVEIGDDGDLLVKFTSDVDLARSLAADYYVIQWGHTHDEATAIVASRRIPEDRLFRWRPPAGDEKNYDYNKWLVHDTRRRAGTFEGVLFYA